jgi:hypothetical protein
MNRHFGLWDQFDNENGANATVRALENDSSNGQTQLAELRERFLTWKRAQDPFCAAQARMMAPEIYFDFVAADGDEHVLDSITIYTIHFDEYRGGGFSEREAWYDIEVKHEQGHYTYAFDKRLVFSGHGRTVLRLWSDNYYASNGWMCPMGEYIIDIKFYFTASGKVESIATGLFAIDI